MVKMFNRGKTQRKPLNQDEVGILFLIAALIFGSWFRLFPVYKAQFPINDGGLFYRMTEAVIENGFRLPAYVHYNGLSIPFAYPPLGFYLAGIVSAALGIKLIQIFLYLPAIVLIVTLFAFFALANTLFESKLKAGLATLIFALLPRSITWLIMGGGVTRSFGELFLILAVLNIYLLFKNQTKKNLWLSILFSSLVCLSHPEAAVHTIGFALVLWVLIGRDRKGTLFALEVAGGTILLTSIWWLPTIIRLGITPFVSAVQTGLHSANALAYFLISFSEEPFLTIIAVLAIIGLAVKIVQREFLLPLWYVLPFVIEPRNAPNVSAIPMALLASTALQELIFPALARLESQLRKIEFRQSLQSRIEKGLFVYLGLCMLTGMYYYDLTITDRKVSPENQKAFQWVAENTPIDSRFLVVTGNTDLFADWTLEWFPVLTNRTSLTTIQGYEWLDGKNFSEHVNEIQLLQHCLTNSTPLTCMEIQAEKLGPGYDYIYVAKKTSPENYVTTIRGNGLIFDLLQDGRNFTEVYQTNEVAIFKELPN
jgi:hypothetical protein